MKTEGGKVRRLGISTQQSRQFRRDLGRTGFQLGMLQIENVSRGRIVPEPCKFLIPSQEVSVQPCTSRQSGTTRDGGSPCPPSEEPYPTRKRNRNRNRSFAEGLAQG